jgi:hypothetical protein
VPERIKLTSVEWKGPWGHPSSLATIDEAELHRIATERGYVKAEAQAKPESEPEWLVRIANDLPEPLKWWEGSVTSDNHHTFPIEYVLSGSRQALTLEAFRRELTGAMFAYMVTEHGARVWLDGNVDTSDVYWSRVSLGDVYRIPASDRAAVEALAACCEAIHGRRTR